MITGLCKLAAGHIAHMFSLSNLIEKCEKQNKKVKVSIALPNNINI